VKRERRETRKGNETRKDNVNVCLLEIDLKTQLCLKKKIKKKKEGNPIIFPLYKSFFPISFSLFI